MRVRNIMSKTISILAALAIVTGAFAAQKPAAKQPTSIKCAVEGGKVNIAVATKSHMYADYKGNRYFFCCDGCPQMFKKNPAKYAKAQHIPTPKAKK
jgi:YHS domain-containing protein